MVSIDEAYVHCSKHIPMLRYIEGEEAVEAEATRRAGDVFKAKNGNRAWLDRSPARSRTPTRRPRSAPCASRSPRRGATRRSRSVSSSSSPQQGGRQARRPSVALEREVGAVVGVHLDALGLQRSRTAGTPSTITTTPGRTARMLQPMAR